MIRLSNRPLATGLLLAILLSGCGPKWEETQKDGFNLVTNEGGQTLGYSPESGVQLLEIDGYAFKDLNRNGSLDPYEDWRLPVSERAADLASRMSVEQIAGLMLYSGHQRIPGGGFRGGGTYGGKSLEESGAASSDLTDQQKAFLTDDNLRHVLMTSVESPAVAAQWNNNVQALVEGLGLGIPANNSSDPRHEAESDEEYTLGAGGDISRWPNSLGLAATFDPGLVEEFGRIASVEYRALGIATALSPQVDLATDPRWYRFSGTFGPHPVLATEMARAYVDGFQTSSESAGTSGGWGFESVNAMVKHWPGGGTGEAGRDAHYGFGKFAVFPGDNLEMHKKPFVEGAFNLNGGTGKAAAVMPYYTISFGQDPGGDNVGNAFSSYFITDQLRGKYGYDGVICTDWGVTRPDEGMAVFGRTPWGVEHLTEAERHYRILMAGCDQFGGNNAAGPVLEAFEMGVAEHGEEFMRERFETSARRLLTNIFQVGLFENPYRDVAETEAIVGKPEYMDAGYRAQQRSVVVLKNQENILPLSKETAVYIPERFVPPSQTFFGDVIPGRWEMPVNPDLADSYFELAESPESADVAIVVITDPENGRTAGYSAEDAEAGGNGFLPISLQYDTYTADTARDPSLAGDAREGDVLNRTYRGKSVTAKNKSDLELIRQTVRAMDGKPVIVILKLSNPTVVAEFESAIQGLVLNFNVQDQAVLDVLTGVVEPSGLLPMQMPANMATVEAQFEDVPLDMEPHVDAAGHAYDFGFGLNWDGPIEDARTRKFTSENK
ncbi:MULTISPECIES: glycoside hydrolase family 3 protein [unclassified Robiginitalea]|uniref:glycoside hydrolase family 3 protein n=1 Tax=Robiginitalea TaxID=252306 RepID=UPI00234A959D|nr:MULTISPECIES: glycoside hydrolase family 3 N-terminal domain-containing protein [unclassified Robiginitalea]MDC6355006.1 glycoside hydrolase family 3 N-terminal domain-containing protein [Robiginitalea sp. PM2]MDC6375273.1 glycoside hydrolase family 3 N-terminal domain-containing protein [Robiginitalea sp. SP8]